VALLCFVNSCSIGLNWVTHTDRHTIQSDTRTLLLFQSTHDFSLTETHSNIDPTHGSSSSSYRRHTPYFLSSERPTFLFVGTEPITSSYSLRRSDTRILFVDPTHGSTSLTCLIRHTDPLRSYLRHTPILLLCRHTADPLLGLLSKPCTSLIRHTDLLRFFLLATHAVVNDDACSLLARRIISSKCWMIKRSICLVKQISLLEIMVVLLLLLLLLLVVDLEVETSRIPWLWTHTSSNNLDLDRLDFRSFSFRLVCRVLLN